MSNKTHFGFEGSYNQNEEENNLKTPHDQAQKSLFSHGMPVVCHMWLNLKFEHFFEKNRICNFENFSIFKLSHRALGMSDFSAIRLIRQEIVHTFRILIKHGSHNFLHTCGTHKAHYAKIRFLCLLCAHHLVPNVCT